MCFFVQSEGEDSAPVFKSCILTDGQLTKFATHSIYSLDTLLDDWYTSTNEPAAEILWPGTEGDGIPIFNLAESHREDVDALEKSRKYLAEMLTLSATSVESSDDELRPQKKARQ